MDHRWQKSLVEFDALGRLDLRIGRIVESTPVARRHSFSQLVKIDLGWLGMRQGWLKTHPGNKDLSGRKVICVVNLPARNREGVISEVIILGVADERGGMHVLSHDAEAATGTPVVW